MASARGRWFLQEYARRNRQAETQQVLAAISRIEGVIRERSGEPYQSFGGALREMARLIADGRSELREPQASDADRDDSPAGEVAQSPDDAFAIAERIRNLARSLRETVVHSILAVQTDSSPPRSSASLLEGLNAFADLSVGAVDFAAIPPAAAADAESMTVATSLPDIPRPAAQSSLAPERDAEYGPPIAQPSESMEAQPKPAPVQDLAIGVATAQSDQVASQQPASIPAMAQESAPLSQPLRTEPPQPLPPAAAPVRQNLAPQVTPAPTRHA